jgi:hypothetical protein
LNKSEKKIEEFCSLEKTEVASKIFYEFIEFKMDMRLYGNFGKLENCVFE